MMTASYHPAPGEPAGVPSLRIRKACDLAAFLTAGVNPYASLVECRSLAGAEVVVFDVEVELPQVRVHPIVSVERIAALFFDPDTHPPETLALRADFPLVPHLNLRDSEFPRSLCLYDEPYADLKRNWTAARYVERVREWLALTAKGTLHGTDQPLEPLVSGAHGRIVLPADVFAHGADGIELFVSATKLTEEGCFLIAERVQPQPPRAEGRFVASVHVCQPQVHGVIRHRPTSLGDLATLVASAGLDLRASLVTRLKAWKEPADSKSILESRLVLILAFPKLRERNAAAEVTEVRCFLTAITVRQLGEALGIWVTQDGQLAQIIGREPAGQGNDVSLLMLNPAFRLNRAAAAAISGIQEPKDMSLAVIGAGALGSQVAINLARCSYGKLNLIDPDDFLPHNAVRHALGGNAVGLPKADAVAWLANTMTDEGDAAIPIAADVMCPGGRAQEIHRALVSAELILDVSASVAVARHLARDVDAPARRVSAFLNPTGDDLIMLAEDSDRSIPLDAIEMQYYRALISHPHLKGHFRPQPHRWRYGQSCRDLTNHIANDLVALHAAIASRALRDLAADPGAKLVIWRADQRMAVTRISVDLSPTVTLRVGEWNLMADYAFLQRIQSFRRAKLPNETGGVLLGSIDLECRLIYLVDALPSPPDSEEWPTVYVRGCRGLRTQVDRVAAETDGMLRYLGEWHSHPNGCSTQPSADDAKVFGWLSDLLRHDGVPAVMMVVGNDNVTLLAGRLDWRGTTASP